MSDPNAWEPGELDKRVDNLFHNARWASAKKATASRSVPLQLLDVVQAGLGYVRRGLETVENKLESFSSRFSPRSGSELLEELRDHLRDDVEQQIAEGVDAEEAWQRAVERFGNMDQVIGDLEQIHHVSVWELLGRLVCLVIAMVMYFTVLEQRVHWLIGIPMFFAVIIAPLLAALWRPVSFRESPVRFLMPRFFCMALLWLSCTMIGMVRYPEVLYSIPLFGMLGACWLEAAQSHRYMRRVSAYCLWAGLLGTVGGMYMVWWAVAAGDISRTGHGIAAVMVYMLYAVVMGRPSWRTTAIYHVPLVTMIYWANQANNNGIISPQWTEYLREGAFSLPVVVLFVFSLAVGGALKSGRTALDRVLAGSFLASVFWTIHTMGNLSDETKVWCSMGAACMAMAVSVLFAVAVEFIQWAMQREKRCSR